MPTLGPETNTYQATYVKYVSGKEKFRTAFVRAESIPNAVDKLGAINTWDHVLVAIMKVDNVDIV